MGKEHDGNRNAIEIVELGIETLFGLMSPEQMAILGYLTRGLTQGEAAEKMTKTVKVIEWQLTSLRKRVREIVGKEREGYAIAKMIRYGVKTGVFSHELPEGPFDALSPQEYKVATHI